MKLIKINSDSNYFVYGTSYTQNRKTEGNKFNVNPKTWLETKVLIKKGIATYPFEVSTWAPVKALESASHITLSSCPDGEPSAGGADAVQAKAAADKMEKQEAVETAKENLKKKKLDEIADAMVDNQIATAVDMMNKGKK